MDQARSVCGRCGAIVVPGAPYCTGCGAWFGAATPGAKPKDYEEVSDYSRLLALLLCVFLGYAGAHRFYVGKLWTGTLWLLTGGMLGIGYVSDIVALLMGRFRDHEGLRLVYWSDFSSS
jgi:hypothetical protein